MNGQGILIVEDESIVALDMRMRLEAMGYRVVDIVDTGALALERAASAGPDLILLDIKLKGPMDGIETARALRGIASIPVIFVTAFADEKTLQRAKLASAYGYIIKPYHERELRVAIELALYKHEYELSVLRARDLAEEANRLKGEFLANISHELKTPLNSVIGFVQLGLDRADDDEQRENLGMALGGARSLLDLIDSILALTKMEAGRLTPASLPFSLGTLVGECVDILAMNASRKGLDASFRWEPGLPDRVVGDEALVRRVMLNLIDNATKFTEAGRVRLELSHAEGRGERAQTLPLLISVTDTGIGMPPEKVESAFERFTQLDGS
ncbi:MAG TPA: response regulator, partial [Rectinemataceae bacterium]|nr:response regulator [Rectinemataceae bacterium]